MVQHTLVEQGVLIIEDSQSHSVGLLWTSDQPDAETSTWQHTQHSQETDVHAAGGIQKQSQQASDRRPTP
jgi:hypothetical protein